METFTITIKQLGHDDFTLHCHKYMSINDIKKMIYHEKGYQSYYQKLIFNGKIIDDNKILCDYGITTSKCFMLCVPRSYINDFYVIIKTIVSSEKIEYKCDPLFTLDDIKQKIYEIDNIPTKNQILINKQKKINNSNTLLQNNIRSGETIFCLRTNVPTQLCKCEHQCDKQLYNERQCKN